MRNPGVRVVLLLCVATLVGGVGLAARQAPLLQGLPEDYPQADIDYGAKLLRRQIVRLRCLNRPAGGVESDHPV